MPGNFGRAVGKPQRREEVSVGHAIQLCLLWAGGPSGLGGALPETAGHAMDSPHLREEGVFSHCLHPAALGWGHLPGAYTLSSLACPQMVVNRFTVCAVEQRGALGGLPGC